MAVVLAQATRGSVSFGHAGDATPAIDVAAGPSRNYKLEMTSDDWVNPANVGTLTMSVSLERSIDGGATWRFGGGFGIAPNPPASNTPGKGGVIQQPAIFTSWDGQAMKIRGDITVGPAPFRWGVTVT